MLMGNMSLNNTAEVCLNLTLAQAEAHVYTTLKLIFITGLIPMISLIGVVANSTFLLVIYRVYEMRTTTNFYLANLAVADILALLTGCVFHLGRYFASKPADYPYSSPFDSRAACEAPILLHYLSLFTSVAFVFLVSYERHSAICRPVTHRITSSRKRTLTLAVIACVIPFIFVCIHIGAFEFTNFCITWPSTSNFIGFPNHIRKCKWRKWANLSIFTFAVFQFIISFIASCFMYIDIVRTLTKSKYSRGKSTNAKNHVARMLAINACVFFICLAPMQTIFAGIIITKLTSDADVDPRVYDEMISRDLFRNLYWMSVFFSLVNSTVNPVIYGGTNQEYRKAFSKALHCFPCKTSSESNKMSDTFDMQKSANSKAINMNIQTHCNRVTPSPDD